MLGAIKHGLANLANPHGRDGRQTFLYWALFVFVLRFGAGMMVSAPLTLKIMGAAMHAARTGQDRAAAQALTMRIVAADLPMMIWTGVAIGVVTIALLGASLVRRLHDSGLSGWLVLLPGAIYGVVLARMPGQIDRIGELMARVDPANPPRAFGMMQADGMMALLGYVPLLLVAWFALRKSEDGPNRYGDDTTRF